MKINKDALVYFSRDMASNWADGNDLMPADDLSEYQTFASKVDYYLGILEAYKVKEEFKIGLPVFLGQNKDNLEDIYQVYDWNSKETYECLTVFYKLLFPEYQPDLSLKIEFINVPFEEWWVKFREK